MKSLYRHIFISTMVLFILGCSGSASDSQGSDVATPNNSLLVSTPTALSPSTPTPVPTPTPEPTPTPMPNAQSIIDKSKIVMFNLDSFIKDETWRFESPNLKQTITGHTEYQAPDKMRGKMEYANEIMNQIRISDQCYEELDWGGETKWREAECEEEFDNGFSPEKITVLDLAIESYPVIKDYEGSATYYINSGELEDFSLMKQTIWYEAFFSDEDPTIQNQPTTYKVEYWIDRDSHVLREIKFVYYIDSISNPDSPFGKVGEPLEIEITDIFSSSNDVKEPIVAPPIDSDNPVTTPAAPTAPAPAATPAPTATPDPVTSSTPNTVCDMKPRREVDHHTEFSNELYTSSNPIYGSIWDDSLEMPIGKLYQTAGGSGPLPNYTCIHKYSFRAEKGVSYAISVYIHSEGLTMTDSFVDLYDQDYQLITVNDDYANGSLGSRISFTAEYDGLYHFLVGEMDNSASNLTYQVQVFKELSDQKLVFISDVTGTTELFLYALDDNSIMKLTDNGYPTDDPRFGYESKEAYLEMQPVFSPNGLGIAYVSNANGNNDIYITHSQGQYLGATNYRYTSDPGNDSDPSWHPGGEHIAFTTTRNEKAEIYLVNLSNNLKEPLIQMLGRHTYDPDFSPDGTLVAFNARLVSEDGLTDIYTHNVATGENTNITNTDMAHIAQHDWSPDGSKLIFRADPDATDTYDPSQLEIFTINKDGSNLVQITNNERLDASPKWSKDGTSIYFISHGNQEKPKIYVMDSDGTNVKRVTDRPESMQEVHFDIYE